MGDEAVVVPSPSPVDEVEEIRRSSIQTPKIDDDETTLSSFERLPDEIIQQILQLTDPNGFASLVLINSKWRSVAQDAHLYAHHLASCPSFSMSHNTLPTEITDEKLPELRKLFAREVKRNLFEAYLRPHHTIIKLISTSISSSSCPGGEGIQFSPSPKGHHLLAYNSSRIYVIDLRRPDIDVKRELKIVRRPAATCIKDDGSMLAVLLTEMQVDIYDLTLTPPKRTQSIILDNSPRTIALSPCGSVLAAAYEGGIEVSSLNSGALSTERRAVKCDAVDALAFSFDGTQILGTTVQSSQPNTVILTAPYYDPGGAMADESIGLNNISALWTTSILFPNTSRDCSHAIFIQNGKEDEASWTFTYDRSFETFRAVRIGDLRNGTTYFTGPIPSATSQNKLIPCTLPAATYYGDLVAAGFQGKEIWLYGVPEDLDAVPDLANANSDNGASTNGLNRRGSSNSSVRISGRSQESEAIRVPQWQVLCDKLRNTFVSGYKIGELDGVTTLKWVAEFGNSSLKERLAVAARGVSPARMATEEEGMDFEDGGRISLLDFDYRVADGETREIVIEVGTKEPETLEEEHRDMETEVAIVRRRTVAQRRVNRDAVMRAATSASRPPPLPSQVSSPHDEDADDDDPLVPRRVGAPPARRDDQGALSTTGEGSETASIIEAQEALDAPYAHASPRSGTTLRRAATAAAVNRRLHTSTSNQTRYEYRRADGRAEHPHESDADNWVPPPPPYQKEDPGEMPDFLRHSMKPVTITPGAAAFQARKQKHQSQPNPPLPATPDQPPARSQSAAPVSRHRPPLSSSVPPVPPVPVIPPIPPLPQAEPEVAQVAQGPARHQHQRGPSGNPPSSPDPPSRPRTSDSRYLDGENIYDVSPPDSPTRAAQTLASNQSASECRTASGATVKREVNTTTPALQHTSPVNQGIASVPAPATTPVSVQQPEHITPQSGDAPALSLRIPSPTLGNIVMPALYPGPQDAASPAVRRLSNAQTWPLPPPPQNSTVAPAGYPYSAPPADMHTSESVVMGYPPPPRPEQLASLQNRADFTPRRLSGGFQVPRKPVGGRGSIDLNNRRSYILPSMAHPPPAPEHDPPQPPRQMQMPPSQQQYQPPQLCKPQPPLPLEINPVPPEEPPLIISTPKGVQGAFDPPDRRVSGRRAEAPILAPVPRHPRPNTQSAILRPTVERLETIYSVASNGSDAQQMQTQPQHVLQGNNLSMYNNSQFNHQLLVPPTVGPSSSTGAPSRVSRAPSLNRRPSRAERSAAKNMADAKKRGWTGRRHTKTKKGKKGGKGKERDLDAVSSAGWTDVTNFSRRSMAFVGAGGRPQGQCSQGQSEKSGHKCVVM